jgi:hypothetical protein
MFSIFTFALESVANCDDWVGEMAIAIVALNSTGIAFILDSNAAAKKQLSLFTPAIKG